MTTQISFRILVVGFIFCLAAMKKDPPDIRAQSVTKSIPFQNKFVAQKNFDTSLPHVVKLVNPDSVRWVQNKELNAALAARQSSLEMENAQLKKKLAEREAKAEKWKKYADSLNQFYSQVELHGTPRKEADTGYLFFNPLVKIDTPIIRYRWIKETVRPWPLKNKIDTLP